MGWGLDSVSSEEVHGQGASAGTLDGGDPGLDPSLAALMFDAETSGGMLIAIDPSRRDALLAALRREGTPCAVEIGRVTVRRGEERVRFLAS